MLNVHTVCICSKGFDAVLLHFHRSGELFCQKKNLCCNGFNGKKNVPRMTHMFSPLTCHLFRFIYGIQAFLVLIFFLMVQFQWSQQTVWIGEEQHWFPVLVLRYITCSSRWPHTQSWYNMFLFLFLY